MNPELAGKYALEVVISGLMNVPFLGDIQVLTRSVLSVEIVEEADTFWHEQTVCWVESYDNTRISETHVPAGFVSAIPIQRIPTDIGPESISWNPKPVYLGFNQDSNIPLDLNDQNLIDADNDGKPGVTVLLEIPLLGMVELYLVQHNDLLLSGRWTGKSYEGQLGIEALEQVTLQSSHRVFNRSNTFIPQPLESYFILRPVKENGCSTLKHVYEPLEPPWRR